MHPLVRDLYKRLLFAGREYPLGLDFVRHKAKAAFEKNAGIRDEIELKRAVRYGRYQVRELYAVIGLRKYRQLRQRYAAVDEASDTSKRGDGL
jgi:hypothetical protein